MSGEQKFWLGVVISICATVVGFFAVIAWWHVSYTKSFIEHGYTRSALVGQPSVHWVLPAK